VAWSGSAPNQVFQRTDGTRTGSQTWQEADAAAVNIIATDHDTHDQDIADGISSTLKRDGGNQPTANLPMNNYIHTGVGDATGLANYVNMRQKINDAGSYCPTVGGTANAITLTSGFSYATYVAGATFSFIVAAANTSSTVTIAVDGLAAKSLKIGASLPDIGALVVATIAVIKYDGTDFQLISSGTAPTAIPVGTVLAYSGSTVPVGILECYGQAVSRSTYATLFAVISTTFGAGDGSTTFNLPDLRGRTIFGEDDMGGSSANRITSAGAGFDGDTLGATGGAETVELVEGNLPAHTHSDGTLAAASSGAHTHFVVNADTSGSGAGDNVTATDQITANRGGVTNDNYTLGGTATEATLGLTSSNGAHTHDVTGATGSVGSGTALNIMPPCMVLKWCIVALPGAALAVSPVGRNEQWFGARLMTARAANGAGSATLDSGNTDITLPVFDFDTSSQEYVQFEWTPPKRWNGGTVTFQPYWTTTATSSPAETAVFSLAGVAISNDDSLNATMGTEQTSSDVVIALNDLHIGPESAAITIGGTPAEADLVVFQLSRVVGSDNAAGDTRIIGVKLFWNSDAASDD
jgi:microcystin-dependent protein